MSAPVPDPALVPAAFDAFESVEIPPVPLTRIGPLADAFSIDTKVFFEVVPDAGLERHLDAIASHRRLAKIRTGGLTPDAFPSSSALSHFLRACVDRSVGCKATAGLHHALTGEHPLTYEADSPSGPMFGFLNVALAAALLRAGAEDDDLARLLAESSPAAFQFDDEGVAWRGRRVSTDDISATRREFFLAFGSCSFAEPVDDLKRLQIL
jgi:hypothetical protein